MTYCFDLDGTLCSWCPRDYEKAMPFQERINKVNKLFDKGCYIKIYTARGMTTGIDYRLVTEFQLKDWGVKYHELVMGKPFADVYVDDKGINDEDFFGGIDG